MPETISHPRAVGEQVATIPKVLVIYHQLEAAAALVEVDIIPKRKRFSSNAKRNILNNDYFW